MLDLTADAEEGSRPAKRQADDELIVVKDEEVEPVIPDWGAAQAAQEEDDYKPEYEDIKPELRVECEGPPKSTERRTAADHSTLDAQTEATPFSTSHWS